MFQHATITHRDRKTTFAFDGPAIPNDESTGTYDNWHERIKVTCTHDAKRKQYEAHVSWCKASERNGYSVEQHAIFTDPYILVHSMAVGRFNESKFGAFCTSVQDVCIDIVNDETDISDVAQLLRKAQGYALVAN